MGTRYSGGTERLQSFYECGSGIEACGGLPRHFRLISLEVIQL